MKKTVSVWGRDYEVLVSRSSQRIWSATGHYLGDVVSGMDRSARAAVKRWKEAATCIDCHRLPRAHA